MCFSIFLFSKIQLFQNNNTIFSSTDIVPKFEGNRSTFIYLFKTLKFNRHSSNYSPCSTIIYVTDALILRPRSAHLDSISKVSLPNRYHPIILVSIQNHGRSRISRRERGKRRRRKKKKIPTGLAGAFQDPFSFRSPAGVENFQGKRGWSREIWRAGFDLKWKWRSAGGENKRCPGVNYEGWEGQRGRQFRESAGKTLFRRWSIFKGVIEQATTIDCPTVGWSGFASFWISRLHFSCFFFLFCLVLLLLSAGGFGSFRRERRPRRKIYRFGLIWLGFRRECIWVKFVWKFLKIWIRFDWMKENYL